MSYIQRTYSDDTNKNIDYRKIKNFMRKHSSTISDDYHLRLKLQELFYYDINGIPIARLKPENEINIEPELTQQYRDHYLPRHYPSMNMPMPINVPTNISLNKIFPPFLRKTLVNLS